MQKQSLTDQLQWVNLSDLHSSWTSSRDSNETFVSLIIFVGSSFLHWTPVCWNHLPGSLGQRQHTSESYITSSVLLFDYPKYASFTACPCQCTCGQVLSQRQSGNRSVFFHSVHLPPLARHINFIFTCVYYSHQMTSEHLSTRKPC